MWLPTYMGPYIVEIPGTPPRKNRRHIVARGRLINSKEYKAFTLALHGAWNAKGYPMIIASGLWSLSVHSIWPRTRHLDLPVPLGDVDAPISWIMDALQNAGILDDDARIMSLQATKSQGPDPSTLITLLSL